MDKSEWIWMGRPAHFAWWRQCQFRLATYVGGYIVSTIGEWTSKENDFMKLDYDRLYETKVFKAIKSKHECYPYEITGDKLDFAGYNTAKEAYKGHLKMCKKWAKKNEREKLTLLKKEVLKKFEEEFDMYNPIYDDGIKIPVWSKEDFENFKSFLSYSLDRVCQEVIEKEKS